MASGAGILLVMGVPCFYIMKSGSLIGCFVGQGIMTIGTGLFGGPLTFYLTNEGKDCSFSLLSLMGLGLMSSFVGCGIFCLLPATTTSAVYTAVALIYNVGQVKYAFVH